jgi:hypothetical protein
LPLLTGPRRRFRGLETGHRTGGYDALFEFLPAARGLRQGTAEMVNLAPLGRNP